MKCVLDQGSVRSNCTVGCISNPRMRRFIPGPWPSRGGHCFLYHPHISAKGQGNAWFKAASVYRAPPSPPPHTHRARFRHPFLVPAQFLAGVIVVVHVFLPEHSHDRLSRLTRAQATPAPRPEPSPPPPRRCGAPHAPSRGPLKETGRGNERASPKEIGVPGARPRSRGLPRAGTTRPLLSLGWGTPTPRTAAPQPRACAPRAPASASRRRGDSRGKGHKAPGPATCSPARRGAALPLLPPAAAATHPAPQLSVRAPCAPRRVPVPGRSRRPPLLASGAARPRGDAATTSSSSSSSSAALAAPPGSALPPRRAHPAHTHSPALSARPTCDSAPGCPLPPASKKLEAFVPGL